MTVLCYIVLKLSRLGENAAWTGLKQISSNDETEWFFLFLTFLFKLDLINIH